MLFGILSSLNEISKKGFENDFLKVILVGLARIVKKHSVIVKIYENKKHVRMSCKRTIGKELGKS
ncbi:hypothetical protein COI75_20495 [Bacillus cereus]|nr:hypothetical protein COI75_20495 [Bacillus cereus]